MVVQRVAAGSGLSEDLHKSINKAVEDRDRNHLKLHTITKSHINSLPIAKEAPPRTSSSPSRGHQAKNNYIITELIISIT